MRSNAQSELLLQPTEPCSGTKPSHRGSRLPEDFHPDLTYACQLIPDINAEEEAEHFRDYWSAQPGQRGVKADWPATWRNWIRICRDRGRYARKAAVTISQPAPVFR